MNARLLTRRRWIVAAIILVVLVIAARVAEGVLTAGRHPVAALPVGVTAVASIPRAAPSPAMTPQASPTQPVHVLSPAPTTTRRAGIRYATTRLVPPLERLLARLGATHLQVVRRMQQPLEPAQPAAGLPTPTLRSSRTTPAPVVAAATAAPAATATQAVGVAPGIPVRLQVPALNIDARTESVGTSGGYMGVPASPWDVAWFDLGPRPGMVGNAVIDGHLDTATGPAIFLNLRALRAGDLLYVTDNLGVERTFRVTDAESYAWDKAPLTQIFGSSTASHLNLVTCDGTWQVQQQNYNQRLVVYSTLVS